MQHLSTERRALMVFANLFPAIFRQKKLKFFPNRSNIPHCVLLFLTLTLILYKLICKTHLLNPQLHWQRRNWSRPSFSVDEKFSLARFWREYLKTQVFSEGKCYFVALLWTIIPCMTSQCWQGDGIWSVSCIQFSAESCQLFPQDFGRTCSEKNVSK